MQYKYRSDNASTSLLIEISSEESNQDSNF